jgi:hypothetical protein
LSPDGQGHVFRYGDKRGHNGLLYVSSGHHHALVAKARAKLNEAGRTTQTQPHFFPAVSVSKKGAPWNTKESTIRSSKLRMVGDGPCFLMPTPQKPEYPVIGPSPF